MIANILIFTCMALTVIGIAGLLIDYAARWYVHRQSKKHGTETYF